MDLRDPEHGDYALTDASLAALPPAVAVPAFVWDATAIPVPAWSNAG